MADNQIKIDLLVKTSEAVTSIRAQKMAIKELLEEMGKIEQGSDGYNKLAKAAGELQDKMADTRNQAKFFADDMKNLSGLASVGRGIAGGFAVLQGTMGLVSGESEELQKAMQKVQITMGIIQGIQEVSMLLNKDETASIFLKSIANKLFNKTKQEQIVTETVANATTVTATAVTNAQTAATGRATIATRLWNLALKANPLVLLISVLAAVAAGVYYFAKATDASKLASDALNRSIEYQNTLFELSREKRQRASEERLKIAEAEGKSEKELLDIKLQESAKEEAEDERRLAQLKVIMDKQTKLRTDARFDGRDEDIQKYDEAKKKSQEEADMIEKNLGLRKGFTNKYYTDRSVLQKKYDTQSLKDTNDANKKTAEAEAKAEADLLAKKKEFANKMLAVDQYIKDTTNEINTDKINAMENEYAKELALIEDTNKLKKEALTKESEDEVKIVKDALEARYGLNTKAYNAQLALEIAQGGRIYTINQQLQTQITQNDEASLKLRNSTLKRLEEERIAILRETTKAIISPEEFTRFTDYITSEISNIPKMDLTDKIAFGTMLSEKDIEDLKFRIETANYLITQYQKKISEGIDTENSQKEIETLKSEIVSFNKAMSDDVAYKTSEEGLKKLLKGYVEFSDIFKDIDVNTIQGNAIYQLADNINKGGQEVSDAITEFSNNVYGKVPEVLRSIFILDEDSQKDSLQKTSEYNIKMASLYLDKYNTIKNITKGKSVEEFTTGGGDAATADKNTKEIKKALDDRYSTLKRASQQAYEDELFEAYKSYSKGQLTAIEYGKKLEVIKQKNVDNLLDIDVTYGVASQEQLAESEQKKIATIQAAEDKKIAIRKRSGDVWVQTVQNSINEVNALLQAQYSRDITNSNLAYDAKKKNLQNEIDDYYAKEANYSIVEQQKIEKKKDFDAQLAKIDADKAAMEREIKIKQFNAQKATDLIQIGINTSLAISKTYAELGGVGAVTPAGWALLAAMAAQGVIAAGFVSAQQPAFATGGMVIGAGGPKDDKISARLSNGESVINAKSTAMYKPILSAINQAGGGVAFPMASGGIASTPEVTYSNGGGSDMEEFKRLLYDVASRPIETYVKESSVTNAQNSINRQNRRTSF